MRINALLLALLGTLFGFSISWAGTSAKPTQITIENDTVWKDTDGNEILCQGGGIYEESGVYYWVGTDMTFDGIRCYSSRDLKNWTDRGCLFKMEESTRFAKGRSSVIRPTLLKNPVSNKYLLIFFEGRGSEASPKIAFAESDSLIGGKYVYKGNTLLDNCIPNDQSVVKIGNDAYIVATYKDNQKIGIFKLDPANYLRVESIVYSAPNSVGIEAPHIFQKDGQFYWFGSLLAGWHSSATHYGVSRSLAGPWSFIKLPINPKTDDSDKPAYASSIVPVKNGDKISWVHHPVLRSDNSYNSQHDFVLPITGSGGTTYIYCGDRWSNFTHMGTGKYVWLPLSWDGDRPTLNCLKSWLLDLTTGNWSK